MNCGVCGKFFDYKCRYDAHKKNIKCQPNPSYILNNIDEIEKEDLKNIVKQYCLIKEEVAKQSIKNIGKINCEFCNKLIRKNNMKRHLSVCKMVIEKPNKYSDINNFVFNNDLKEKIINYFDKLKIIRNENNCEILRNLQDIIFNYEGNKNFINVGNEIRYVDKNGYKYHHIDLFKKNFRFNLYNLLIKIYTREEYYNIMDSDILEFKEESENKLEPIKTNKSIFFELIFDEGEYNKFIKQKNNKEDFDIFIKTCSVNNKHYIKKTF